VAGPAGFEPVTSAVTGQRSKPAELRSHNKINVIKLFVFVNKFFVFNRGPKFVNVLGGREMSGITSSPPIRWTESSETHLDDVVARPGLEPGLRGYEPRELPLLHLAINE
jgi:hypothetical protein